MSVATFTLHVSDSTAGISLLRPDNGAVRQPFLFLLQGVPAELAYREGIEAGVPAAHRALHVLDERIGEKEGKRKSIGASLGRLEGLGLIERDPSIEIRWSKEEERGEVIGPDEADSRRQGAGLRQRPGLRPRPSCRTGKNGRWPAFPVPGPTQTRRGLCAPQARSGCEPAVHPRLR